MGNKMKKELLFFITFLSFFMLLSGGGWLPTDIRLDTGDTPGANDSVYPQISSIGSHVYAVWRDSRNGAGDIYFNYSIDNGVTFQTTAIRLD
jgi:hypothetical protein